MNMHLCKENGVALIDLVDPVRWSQMPPSSRILHELREKFTPVHAGGDWVGLKPGILTATDPFDGLRSA